MKKRKMLFSIVTLLIFSSSLSFANGLNLNGLGARAVAMGGAFVGLADDFTAVFWNPAGIAQFNKKYIGFYGTDIIPTMNYTLEAPTAIGPVTLADAQSVRKNYLAGLASYYHPVSENLVAGIAVYAPSGLGIEWEGADLANISGPPTFLPNPNIDWRSKIFVLSISPALAYKVNDQFMVGATLNINYGSFETAQYAGVAENPYYPVIGPEHFDLGQQTLDMTGWGFGATFGVLVKPNEMFSIGATFRTPSKISFSGETVVSGIGQLGLTNTKAEIETDVTWPMWLACGVAFKPIENLTLTADIQHTQWSEIEVIELTFTDPTWKALMGMTEGNKLELHWDNGTQIRFGAEYWASEKFALRAGYYFDPGPAPDKTRNILLPITDFNSFAVGIGYNIDGLVIDLGVEYLIGKDNDVPYEKTNPLLPTYDPEYESAMPGVYELKILALELSLGYEW